MRRWEFIIIGGNGDSIFKRLMVTVGRPDMADKPEVRVASDRVRNEAGD